MHKAHPPPPGYSSVACNAPLYNKRRRSRGGLGVTPSNVWGKCMGGDLTIDHKLPRPSSVPSLPLMADLHVSIIS